MPEGKVLRDMHPFSLRQKGGFWKGRCLLRCCQMKSHLVIKIQESANFGLDTI